MPQKTLTVDQSQLTPVLTVDQSKLRPVGPPKPRTPWESFTMPPEFLGPERTGVMRSQISALAGKYLPPWLAGPAAAAANVEMTPLATAEEVARQIMTPANLLTMGAAKYLAPLRAAPAVPKLLRGAIAAGELGVGALYGFPALKSLATRRQPDESWQDYVGRTVGAVGQLAASVLAPIKYGLKGGPTPEALHAHEEASLTKSPAAARTAAGYAVQALLNEFDKERVREADKHYDLLRERIDGPENNFPREFDNPSEFREELVKLREKYRATATGVGIKESPLFSQIVNESLGEMIKTGKYKYIRPEPPRAWGWEQTKQVREAVGKEAARLERTQGKREAAPYWGFYDKLGKKMLTVASRFGLGEVFKHANAVHSGRLRSNAAWLGAVVDAPNGEAALAALAKGRGEIEANPKAIRDYGLDPVHLSRLAEDAQGLQGGRFSIARWIAIRHIAAALGKTFGIGFWPGYLGADIALGIRGGGRIGTGGEITNPELLERGRAEIGRQSTPARMPLPETRQAVLVRPPVWTAPPGPPPVEAESEAIVRRPSQSLVPERVTHAFREYFRRVAAHRGPEGSTVPRRVIPLSPEAGQPVFTEEEAQPIAGVPAKGELAKAFNNRRVAGLLLKKLRANVIPHPLEISWIKRMTGLDLTDVNDIEAAETALRRIARTGQRYLGSAVQPKFVDYAPESASGRTPGKVKRRR